MFVCPECGAPQPVQGHCPADGTPPGEDVLLGTMIGAYRVARLRSQPNSAQEGAIWVPIVQVTIVVSRWAGAVSL